MTTPINRRQTPLIILMVGIGLLLLAIAIAILVQSDSPAASTPAPVSADPVDAVERVSQEDAYAAWQSESAVFLDVRFVEEFDQSHIAGAVSIPYNEISQRIGELDPQDWIITYCT